MLMASPVHLTSEPALPTHTGSCFDTRPPREPELCLPQVIPLDDAARKEDGKDLISPTFCLTPTLSDARVPPSDPSGGSIK